MGARRFDRVLVLLTFLEHPRLGLGTDSGATGSGSSDRHAGANSSPGAVEVNLNAVGQDTYRGEPVYRLQPVAHIRVQAPADVRHIRLELYRVDGSQKLVARFFARQTDSETDWFFDWEDPPSEPHRLVILGESPGGEWVPLTQVLVKGVELSRGATGVLTRPVPGPVALEDVLHQYFDLTSQGRYAEAWEWVHPKAQQPPSFRQDEARSRFLAQSPGPALKAVLGMQLRASVKFPWCMCSLPNVAEVLVQGADGTEGVIHAAQDDQGA